MGRMSWSRGSPSESQLALAKALHEGLLFAAHIIPLMRSHARNSGLSTYGASGIATLPCIGESYRSDEKSLRQSQYSDVSHL